ncbi:MAG: HAMP domain-containing protein [bacterium]|nr:HAMP domain-containing protein [bacterium]
MPRKRVLWQLYPAYLIITLVSLLAVAWYASRSLRQFYFDQTALDLEVRATLLSGQVEPFFLDSPLNTTDSLQLQSIVSELGLKTDTRLSAISLSGRIIADSHEPSVAWQNQTPNPEFAAARAGAIGIDSRFRKQSNEPVMYAAVPLTINGDIRAVIRASIPIGFIEDALWEIRIKIGVAALLIGIISAMISLWASRRISRPLQELRTGASKFAAGDLSNRMPISDSEEIGGLAEAMNEMALQLDERIQTITRQRNEQEVILAGMIEGVIAVDTEERLLIVNRAASELLQINADTARGRTIQEVVRNTDLLRLIDSTLATNAPTEGEIAMGERGEQTLQAHGTLLRDQEGATIGALLVFYDITKLRKLENLRREFVANVSHELKTPITSIKGFVEALQDGAIDNTEDAKRFLGIITRQVDRLHSIIEDLLALSRIEQDAEKSGIPLELGSIYEVLHSAMQACAHTATTKKMQLSLTCDQSLRTRINPPLLEQAVVNLIDNAIKYSDSEKPIEVAAGVVGGELIIAVRDHGKGIGKEHLPRLWERFYRVDTARSRSMGGTGLGLAITKHIVLAHNGRVSVESEPGIGSTFKIHLPASQF